MPSVFLSYSRKNASSAELLVRELRASGVDVWRDQQNLRAGESWPKILGDAIDACDAFVLLWSRQAAESEWVEKEWTTALALHKPVLPCLLDSTPLPSSLRGIQSIETKDWTDTAQSIATTLGLVTKPLDKSLKRKGRKTWAAAVFVLLLVLAGIVTQSKRPGEQTLAGIIGDENGQPLAHVQLSVLLDGKIVTTSDTDGIGHYRLKIAAPANAEVTLVAKKTHYLTDQRYARVGNTDLGFNMKKDEK